MNIQIKHLLRVAILVLVFEVSLTGMSSAQSFQDFGESPCDSITTYSGDLSTPIGSYDLYIKLGQQGQKAPATLYNKDTSGTCKEIGSKQASGDVWRKLASWEQTKDTPAYFSLDTPAIKNLPDANRPTMLMVPKSSNICKPSTECDIIYAGVPGFIRSAGTTLKDDSLRILRVTDPNTDQIKRVDYFVGADFAYSTKEVEKFDTKYVPGGSHTLYRVIRFSSGQQIVLPEKFEQGIANGFSNYIFTLFSRNTSWLQILMIVALLLSTFSLIMHLVLKLHKKNLWRQTHTLSAAPISTDTTGGFLVFATRVSKYKLWAIAVLAVLLLINATQSHIIKTVRVSGESMTYTLNDNDTMLVSKIGKSWAQFNKQEYLPKRGEIIIARKADSAFDTTKKKPNFFVKRVIGLPGERIVVKNGKVTVYRVGDKKGFNPDKDSSWEKTMRKEATGEDIDITLDQNEIFVLGDNRPGSIDSRTNGPIKTGDIYGHVIMRLGSFDKLKLL